MPISPRFCFIYAIIATCLITALLGTTLAWTSSRTIRTQRVSVGSVSWDLGYEAAPSGLIGPAGDTRLVGMGTITNTGDFNIRFRSGIVIARNVDVGHSRCNAGNFSGNVNNLFPGEVIAPNETADPAYAVYITMSAYSPFSCVGAILTYDLRITVETAENPDFPEPGHVSRCHAPSVSASDGCPMALNLNPAISRGAQIRSVTTCPSRPLKMMHTRPRPS